MKENTMAINVGDIVKVAWHTNDTASHYEVIKMTDTHVIKVKVIRNERNPNEVGSVVDCKISLDDWDVVEPPLSPKELVCRKVLQLENRFKTRASHKIQPVEEVEEVNTRNTNERAAEIISRYVAERRQALATEQLMQEHNNISSSVRYNPQTWATDNYFERAATNANTSTTSAITSALLSNAYTVSF